MCRRVFNVFICAKIKQSCFGPFHNAVGAEIILSYNMTKCGTDTFDKLCKTCKENCDINFAYLVQYAGPISNNCIGTVYFCRS